MTNRVLITGASAGLGREYARQLARRGHDVLLVARDTVRLDALAAELTAAYGVAADVFTADLVTTDGLRRTVEAIADESRPVQMLVNNAGASLAGWFGTTDIADEDRQLDLLVRAPMHLMDAALKTMAARGYGAIMNICSVAAHTPRGTYSAHKIWLLNVSEWAHHYYAGSGVRVMAVSPGFVRTEFHQRGEMDLSGVPSWMWLTAPTVVGQSLRDLDRGRAVSTPSVRYKVLSFLARHLPRNLVQKAANRGR